MLTKLSLCFHVSDHRDASAYGLCWLRDQDKEGYSKARWYFMLRSFQVFWLFLVCVYMTYWWLNMVFVCFTGVDDIDIDMAMQKVTVMGWADQRKVLKAVRKTGRRAELWPYPYNPESYNFNQQYYYQKQHHETKVVNHYTKMPTSSYNYHKHGYNDEEFGRYQKPPYATIFDEEASAMFSDENPHACSIM